VDKRTRSYIVHVPPGYVEIKTYGSGKDGAEVVLVVIEGGGHTWPGRETKLKLLGKSTKNVSANDVMWEFFVKHPVK